MLAEKLRPASANLVGLPAAEAADKAKVALEVSAEVAARVKAAGAEAACTVWPDDRVAARIAIRRGHRNDWLVESG